VHSPDQETSVFYIRFSESCLQTLHIVLGHTMLNLKEGPYNSVLF